ncbi:MAG: hypothetical protein OXC28_07640 [Defluviicoccus sp.]|nr:hypothetical protein [Defluviicoccus sp.]
MRFCTKSQLDRRAARRAVGGAFAGIWLKAATPEYDLVGGGITIREDRTRDAAGRRAVAFTSGHIAYVQTLLVRAADAGRFAGYRGLSPVVRIAAMPGTTGEERLLQLTGYIGPDGALRAGSRVHLASGAVREAEDGERLVITAASSSPAVEGRRRLEPPDDTVELPQVVYFQEEGPLLDALRTPHEPIQRYSWLTLNDEALIEVWTRDGLLTSVLLAYVRAFGVDLVVDLTADASYRDLFG